MYTAKIGMLESSYNGIFIEVIYTYITVTDIRQSDISTYFRKSRRFRDNESRLYIKKLRGKNTLIIDILETTFVLQKKSNVHTFYCILFIIS